jgi:hypothetical protein
MTALLTLALFLAVGSEPPPQPVQSFNLESGDFRWIPFTVHQVPTGVNCHFDVVSGNATVHAELLPMSEFRLFDRGRDHETMALTAKGRSEEFRHVIYERGQYAVVIVNDKGAPPAVVSVRVETNIDPPARLLSPERRLTVILLSFAFFFITISWSSRKLILGMRGADHSNRPGDRDQ